MNEIMFRRIRQRIFERLIRIIWTWVPPGEADWMWNDAVRNRPQLLDRWAYAMVAEAFRRRDRHLVSVGLPPEGWLPYTFVHDVLPDEAGRIIYHGLKPEQRQQLLAVLLPHAESYWRNAPPHARLLILTNEARKRRAAMAGQGAQGNRWQPQHINIEAGVHQGQAGLTTDPNGNIYWRGPHY